MHHLDCICNICDEAQKAHLGVDEEFAELAALDEEVITNEGRAAALATIEAKYDAYEPRDLDYPYIYRWGNNAIRATFKGKACRMLARGTMNSCLLEFEDGRQLVASRIAVRSAPQ